MRSVSTTIVGLPSERCRSTWFAYNSISMDLPDPWVCQTTPACPLLRTASRVLPYRLGHREVLVRLGDPLDQPAVRLGERDVAAQDLDEPPLLEQPVQQQVDREVGVGRIGLGPACPRRPRSRARNARTA